MALAKPIRKIEAYLYALASGESEDLPAPRTKVEHYLKEIAENPPSRGQGPAGPAGPALTTSETGAVTGGTVTYTDDSTSAITVTTSQG